MDYYSKIQLAYEYAHSNRACNTAENTSATSIAIMSATIVAIATPPGRGGVGIIRLSGPLALTIAHQLAPNLPKKLKPRHAMYVPMMDTEQCPIDEGIVLYFQAPHSFTGEDVIEFQCHGAPIVLDRLVACCVLLGARIAAPGEFSERAFLNDKMDLTQAEAIADLINANTETAARMAVKSLQGEFSKQINQLNEKIIELRLYVEATIDFSDEEIDFISEGKVGMRLADLLDTLAVIAKQAVQGVLLREGLSVVIAGPPNAGKSTLINCLAARDVAIVTDIPGTTRDVMREHIIMDGLPIHIIDTAGLRDSQDVVEQEGIKRALLEVARADCILLVTDIQQEGPDEELQALIASHTAPTIPLIKVVNKVDAVGQAARIDDNCVYLSAQIGDGVDFLKDKIKTIAGYLPTEGVFLARRRHLQALDAAKLALLNAAQQLHHTGAAELLAEDLRVAHTALSEITGEFTSDDLLGKIFSTFCIGK
jgi:tRNA modification GTPase